MNTTPLTSADVRAIVRALVADADAQVMTEGSTDLNSAYLLGRRDAFAACVRMLEDVAR